MDIIEIDKIGSAASTLRLSRRLQVAANRTEPRAGDVVVVRALSESITYGNLELPSGRLAKINTGDIIAGVFGARRALKGFVGDVPATAAAGDRLHLLNMGGVVGRCTGHHSSLTDAIEVEVIGVPVDDEGCPLSIARGAIAPVERLGECSPLILVAGSCMNSGKTVAAAELIKQASQSGMVVAGAKLSGVAALRDTYNMLDHGAVRTATFLDCGLPSTACVDDLAPYSKAILAYLNGFGPDLIVAELGDGVLGGYSVDTILRDAEIQAATTSLVFCASDYVGVVGGTAVLGSLGIEIDVVAGSVTDSPMGEEYVRTRLGIEAANARRSGRRLFDLAVKPADVPTFTGLGSGYEVVAAL